MKPARLVWIATMALLSTAPLHAQQPPNPTSSDMDNNTAGGTDALLNLVLPAHSNTAFGSQALRNNTDGGWNSSFGHNALRDNTTGDYNTAVGASALVFNTTGIGNTTVGSISQYAGGGTGSYNTSVGAQSLYLKGGDNNVAVGAGALYVNTDGNENVGVGAESLSTSRASRNVGIGYGALRNVSDGDNIALGHLAGSNLTTGSYNIAIGNPGVAGEAQTIRIGNTSVLDPNRQMRAFVGGIYGATISSGATVLINSSGQIGTVVSSSRFKKDVADMGDASSRLLKLRPVTFRYKTDETQTQQYGLIAEEVAKIYPDLVVRNQGGEIDSVQYHELAPMLLNELQKQHLEIEALRQERAQDLVQLKELRRLLQKQAAAFAIFQTRLGEADRVASR